MKTDPFKLFIIILLVFNSSCSKKSAPQGAASEKQPTLVSVDAEEEAQNDKMATGDQLFMRFHRTPCFGTCPTYEITIRYNGKATFHVKDHVDLIGKYKGNVEQTVIEMIGNQAHEIGFFELNKQYPGEDVQVADLPSTIIYINWNGKEKKINNMHYQSPPELGKFEKFIDKALEGVDWKLVRDVGEE